MLFSEFARTPRPFWPPCWNFPLSFQNKYCLKTVFPCQNLPCHHQFIRNSALLDAHSVPLRVQASKSDVLP